MAAGSCLQESKIKNTYLILAIFSQLKEEKWIWNPGNHARPFQLTP